MIAYIGIDGLLEIAKRHGLESYTTYIGPGADGLECVAILRWADKDTEFRATRNEAILDGRKPQKCGTTIKIRCLNATR